MSAKKTRPFSKKHDSDLRPDAVIQEAFQNRAVSREIPCALALNIAKDLQVEPKEVGRTADVLDIPIVKCQLGLFGYRPEKKIIKPENAPDREIQVAVKGSSVGNRLPCEKVLELAARFNTSPLAISNVCQANAIRIKSCQLGAF